MPTPRPPSRSTRPPSSSPRSSNLRHRGASRPGRDRRRRHPQGRQRPGRAIGLRADMDALHVHGEERLRPPSQNPGRMHACGHDGHTAMLLGAARYLAETRNFDGTVHFIFQPAEENEGGGRRHGRRTACSTGSPSRPSTACTTGRAMPAGTIAVRPGPMMAAYDIFEITVAGSGAHAAMPHLGVDPVVAAAQIVDGAADDRQPQRRSARRRGRQRHADPRRRHLERHPRRGGAARHLPRLRPGGAGRDRAGDPPRRRRASRRRSAPASSCATSGAIRRPSTARPRPSSPPAAAAKVVGADNVNRDLAAEHGLRGFRLHAPGAARRLHLDRQRRRRPAAAALHNPHYDFNDAILPIGASYWVRLVETMLGDGVGKRV